MRSTLLRRLGAAVPATLLVLPLLAGSPAVGTVQPRSETPPVASAERVLLISLDGFNSKAIKALGSRRTPTLHRLLREGAGTLNARTAREITQTMPNHTGMITGRRVSAAHGGHGVTFNSDNGGTVQQAAGHPVASVFDVVQEAGGRTALFTSKEKFAFFRRSWPTAINKYVLKTDNTTLMNRVIKQLDRGRAFTMLHLSAADAAGHKHGFMTPKYLAVVERLDALLGRLLAHLDAHPDQRAGLSILVTADHGGPRRHIMHSQADLLANYRVPLIAWGEGVSAGDLYAMNPEFANPGTARTTYSGPQPVRNGMVANLSTSLLGLPAVPGSTFDPDQHLSVG